MFHPTERRTQEVKKEKAIHETAGSRPEDLQDYVETTLNKKEKRDALLEKIHKTASDGVALLEALHTNTFANAEEFFTAQGISDPSPNEQELFSEIISEWNKRSEYAERFFSKLTYEQKNSPHEKEKTIEEAVMESRGIKTLHGTIRVERKGPYVVIHCDNDLDYTAFYHGRQDSSDLEGDGGTYHAKMAFSTTDTNQILPEWVDTSKPPPRRKKESFNIPVLLVNDRQNQQTEAKKTFIHEQQHLINQLFAKLYGSSDKITGTPQERLQDEIIAGVREGEAGAKITARLKAGGSYDAFIQGSPETNGQRDQILQETEAALSTTATKQFFSTEETRALLALHLMYTKPNGIARRIKTITDYLERQLISKTLSSQEGPVHIQNLPELLSNEKRGELVAKELGVKQKHASYLEALKEFVLHPSQKKTELETRKQEYLAERASLIHALSTEAPAAVFSVMTELDNRFVTHGPPPRRKRV